MSNHDRAHIAAPCDNLDFPYSCSTSIAVDGDSMSQFAMEEWRELSGSNFCERMRKKMLDKKDDDFAQRLTSPPHNHSTSDPEELAGYSAWMLQNWTVLQFSLVLFFLFPFFLVSFFKP